ncbi:MAG: bis(5'-nucleosyl)-tetraphosphatase (symmetrical) YqeK, partial [Phascolarctobacterium sp.]|nr:bis(5'-nucleosyl)-tetraphosphatase (symmetrical) YqeK [Candidatus Phascolarctobacterium caballi]
MYTVEQIKDELEKRLTEKRKRHCYYVSEWAGKIAGYDGYSVEKAILAGLLHDVAKQIPVEKLLEMALTNGLIVTTAERNNPHSLHGRVGAVIAEKEFGVTDKEILAAIAYHSGRPGMGRLEKIVFLSDYMQKLFSWGVDISPIVKDNGLDAAIMKVMHHVIKYCVDKDIQDEKTFETFDAILLEAQQKVEQDATQEKIAAGKVPAPFAYFDKSYELNKKQRIHLTTVQ